MPNNVRDEWLYLRPVVPTVKNNRIVTIPAFSQACGFKNFCLNFTQYYSGGNVQTNFGITHVNLPLQFTVEIWVKLTPGFSAQAVDAIIISGDDKWSLDIQSGVSQEPNKLRFNVSTFNSEFLNITNHVTSIDKFPMDNKWHHIAATFINALPLLGEGGEPVLGEGGEPILSETGEIALFIDGVFQNSVNTIGNIQNIADLGLGGIANGFQQQSFAFGKLSEVRLWNYVRTQEQIIANKGILQSTTASGLVAYWRLREGQGTVLPDLISGLALTITAPSVVWDEDSPFEFLGFGASFIVRQYKITTSGPCSLRFPVKLPRNSNHALCVSWTDKDTGEFFRRLVYGGVGEDIDTAPSGQPLKYAGEKVSTTFTLEFWNRDGEETIDLENDLTIYTSHTDNPNTGIDHSNRIDASPVVNSALSAPFPWIFPVVFNVQQTYT